MKIFGKRKSKPVSEGDNKKTDDNAPTSTANSTSATAPAAEENVTSYFSNVTDDGDTRKKKKPKKNPTNEINGEEIETLLKMDYEKLNSKQRRLVRRHKERSGEDVGAVEKAPTVNDDGAAAADKINNSNAPNEDCSKDDNKNEKAAESNTSTETNASDIDMNKHEKELLTKLAGLNSKDRRKFLRQLKSDNPSNVDIDKLEQEAKCIAERNITIAKEADKTPKAEEPKPPAKKSKPKKVKDLSHLPPEEIARREKQREMQIEAAERRARGEDLNHGHKHPLNSERRRANRRKPARKSQGKGVGGGARKEFNSVGYQMRMGG